VVRLLGGVALWEVLRSLQGSEGPHGVSNLLCHTLRTIALWHHRQGPKAVGLSTLDWNIQNFEPKINLFSS
jgi:hypothetical protein